MLALRCRCWVGWQPSSLCTAPAQVLIYCRLLRSAAGYCRCPLHGRVTVTVSRFCSSMHIGLGFFTCISARKQAYGNSVVGVILLQAAAYTGNIGIGHPQAFLVYSWRPLCSCEKDIGSGIAARTWLATSHTKLGRNYLCRSARRGKLFFAGRASRGDRNMVGPEVASWSWDASIRHIIAICM